jgi:hypothetical protein
MMTDPLVPSVRPSTGNEIARQRIPRRSPRVDGPFDGRVIGALTWPIRIYQLNAGGCLVECDDAVTIRGRFHVQIDLGGEGWISVEADRAYSVEHFGFVVTFVRMSDANRARIERTIERQTVQPSQRVWTLGGAA